MENFGRVSLFTKGCVICALPADVMPGHGEKCVLELEYGLDVGTYVGPCECASRSDGKPVTEGDRRPRILRIAKDLDIDRVSENAEIADQAMRSFADLLGDAGTPIKPLLAHFTLNRERLLLVFGSPEPVDSRLAVGVLQREYNTHVEVRHVNVRDEASVVGGIGSCGRPLCCASWLRVFKPVNVRMLKAQDIPLNPMSINGCCGRLKCCMRFEYEGYQEAGADLPEIGMRVCWQGGDCAVVGRDVLRRSLLIRTPDNLLRHVAVGELSHLEKTVAATETKEEKKHEDPTGERPESGAPGEA